MKKFKFALDTVLSYKQQVLAPIFFEEYAQLTTREIAELVRSRIAEKIDMQLERV